MIVLVTGATAGFGAAICRRLVTDGHRVIAAGRRTERLSALAAELGAACHPLTLDVTDRAATEAFVAALPPDFSEIDVCVNNAGLALGLEMADKANLDDWDRMIDTNCRGLAYVTRAVLPGMVARNRGHVINIGSTAGEWPYPGGNGARARPCAARRGAGATGAAARAIPLGRRRSGRDVRRRALPRVQRAAGDRVPTRACACARAYVCTWSSRAPRSRRGRSPRPRKVARSGADRSSALPASAPRAPPTTLPTAAFAVSPRSVRRHEGVRVPVHDEPARGPAGLARSRHGH